MKIFQPDDQLIIDEAVMAVAFKLAFELVENILNTDFKYV